MIRSLVLELHEDVLYTDDDGGRDTPHIEDEIDENKLPSILQDLKSKRNMSHIQFIHDERDQHYFWV